MDLELEIQKLNFPAIFGLPIATKSTLTFNVIIVIMYQLHHVLAHKFLFHLICLMSIPIILRSKVIDSVLWPLLSQKQMFNFD